MISARDFCQEPGYPVSIFFTYSFDPLFFERIAIDDLNVGGTRRILVLADANEINDAMKRCAGQIFYVGRKYTLAESGHSNLFHPKMIARLAPEGGRIWIGSGNLTYSGWGGNHELATAWSIGPGMQDSGGWLLGILRAAGSVTRSDSFHTQIEGLTASIPWLFTDVEASERSSVLLGMPGRPLGPQVARRWEGRRFTSVKIFTGSTDENGAFLRWAHTTFGVQKATVCLTPAFASFGVEKLTKLPMNVRFVARDPKRRVHAKFYWFSGPQGDAAIMGSANCSAAAWLANSDQSNVELVTVYDAPERRLFASILADFDGAKLMPKDVLTAPVVVTKRGCDAAGDNVYRITSLRLRASRRTIEAILEPTPANAEVTLIIEAKHGEFRIAMKSVGARLVGQFPREASVGLEALFATMEIASTSGVVTTPPRWIDNDRSIENAARSGDIDPNHAVFGGRGFGGASEHRIWSAIQSISSSLLNSVNAGFEDSPGMRQGTSKPEVGGQTPAKPANRVDPALLTYNLDDYALKSGSNADHGGPHDVSLHAIMRMLFTSDEEREVDLSQERLSADEPEERDGDDEPEHVPDDPIAPRTRSDAEALSALRSEIDCFLSKLASANFAETCSVSNLVPALAFPILLGVKGGEEGWFPDNALASIACHVVRIMFSTRYGRDKPVGLLKTVDARYTAAGRQAEFLKVVGDGTLYSVLLASLAKPEAASLPDLVQQADAIYRVINCSELVASVDPDQLTMLIQKVIIQDAADFVSARASALADASKALTTALEARDNLHPGRKGRTALHRAGSLLWTSPGWEVVPLNPAESYCAGINLVELAAEETGIEIAVGALWKAMQVPRESSQMPIPDLDKAGGETN